MRKYTEYDNRERRAEMKAKRTRKIFERRNNVTADADIAYINDTTDFAEAVRFGRGDLMEFGKSLLTILEAERAAVNDYTFAKEYEAKYKAKAETAEDIIEKEVFLDFVAEYAEIREKVEARITEVRKEIKEYLNHIM